MTVDESELYTVCLIVNVCPRVTDVVLTSIELVGGAA
jgi:hypothetical protein